MEKSRTLSEPQASPDPCRPGWALARLQDQPDNPWQQRARPPNPGPAFFCGAAAQHQEEVTRGSNNRVLHIQPRGSQLSPEPLL